MNTASGLLLAALMLTSGWAMAVPAHAPAASAAYATEVSRMPPEQVRQKLREAGLPESALDSYMSRAAAAPLAAGSTDSLALPAPPATPRVSDAEPAPAPANADAPANAAFGAGIFRYSPTTFEPLAYGPVGPDYVVGPGDELVLTLWGDDQISLTMPVGREGNVTLPEVGQVDVSGLALEGVRARLRSALARVYSGLRPPGQRSTTFMNVSLGHLRAIQVFILGDVVRPGGYTVSSVSRVLNALYAAGGPVQSGSMRDVRVLRGGRLVGAVDLYDVILRGDTSREVRLENGDVIFVPPAGTRVALSGPVRRPGLFELRPGERLRALMEMAGGALPSADLERAQVDRIVPPSKRDSLPGQARIAIDVPLGRVLADAKRDVALADGDRVTVFAIAGSRINTVSIEGQGVLKPGVYEFHPGMRIRDLIERAGGLVPEAYTAHAQLVRTAPDRTRSTTHVNLDAALGGAPDADLELQPLDELSVVSRWDMQTRSTVSIHGLVRHPGEYELLDNMTLADLLFRAGGLRDEASAVRAEIARVDSLAGPASVEADTFSVALAREFAKMPAATSLRLRPRDAVFIRIDPSWRDQTYVTVAGEVRYPGVYSISRRDERVGDLVRRAGGLTDLAYARGAVFTRAQVGRINIDLTEALKKPASFRDFAVESGDVLTVPRYQPVVAIEGAVWHPGVTLFRPGEDVGYYITQASGFQRNADRRGVVVVLANGDVQRGGHPDAGSRIVVPARPDTTKSETLKDVATILSILTSAVTTIVLVRQVTK